MAGHGKKPSPSDPASDAPSSEDITWRDTKTEDDKLAHAVARGKSVLWPVTFLSTLGIGIGCSGGGIVKTKEWTNRFYFQVFIATLIGWSALLVIQLVIMNELYTERKSRNSKVVVALALAFGGWVSGYFIAILVVVVVWRPVAKGSGAGALLVVQAILGVGTSLLGFYFYVQGYVRPIKASRPRLIEKRSIRTPTRKASDAIKRRFSGSSRGSTRAGAANGASSRRSTSSRRSRKTVHDSTDGGSSSADTDERSRQRSSRNARGSTAGRDPSGSSANGEASSGTDGGGYTSSDDEGRSGLLSATTAKGTNSPDTLLPRPSSAAEQQATSFPPLPAPPSYTPYPPRGAAPAATSTSSALTVPVQVVNSGASLPRRNSQPSYVGNSSSADHYARLARKPAPEGAVSRPLPSSATSSPATRQVLPSAHDTTSYRAYSPPGSPSNEHPVAYQTPMYPGRPLYSLAYPPSKSPTAGTPSYPGQAVYSPAQYAASAIAPTPPRSPIPYYPSLPSSSSAHMSRSYSTSSQQSASINPSRSPFRPGSAANSSSRSLRAPPTPSASQPSFARRAEESTAPSNPDALPPMPLYQPSDFRK